VSDQLSLFPPEGDGRPVAPFDAPGSRWFTIPAHRSFTDDLAAGLLASLDGLGPEAHSDAIVLTPTRRGARALAEAFVRAAGGRPVLLPQIRAVGDLDEGEPPFEPGTLALDLPAAVSPLRRRFELARLVRAHQDAVGRDLDAPAALEMADALTAFLDGLTIEETLEGADIAALAEGDLARHWAISARVLALVLEAWPKRLEEIGLIDPVARRVRLSRLLGEQWRARPPTVPLIAAGSTGTAPATADLLAAVAAAPRGCVVLPGLDLDLAEEAWAMIRDEPGEQHPQGAMKRLLDRHGLVRADVAPWPARESLAEARRGRSRRRLVNEALRPAEATADWLELIKTLEKESPDGTADLVREGLEGVTLLTARNEEEAAAVAALLMREVLETPEKTCALVTPDQDLARRVSARLSRWGVEADSSAGAPLAGFPVGALAGLVARLAVDPADPVVLLAMLKSPLVRLGWPDGERLAGREAFERWALRGSRRDGWPSFFALVEAARDPAREPGREPGEARLRALDRAEAFARHVQGLLAPLAALAAELPAPDAVRVLAEVVEALARDEQGRLGDLWAGPAGEAAARLLAGLMEDGGALPAMDASAFHEVLDRLLRDETVRPGGATHPRLRILGAIEARLVRADRVILAGLEEGTWPQGAPVDPFLSRPMRRRLGLPPPERRIGLSAHDFAQAACAPEVCLLHSLRRAGQPAVKSRWLWRLETLVRGAGEDGLPRRDEVLAWARALDAPLAEPPPHLLTAPRPEPKPPVDLRPRALHVTQVEMWVRDPYAVYARHILRLYPMDRPDQPVDARTRGSAIHRAVEAFAAAWPTLDQATAPQAFADLYWAALRGQGAPDTDFARERALGRRAGAWMTDFEARRRAAGATILVEQPVSLELADVGFTLSARADRIELADGFAHVIDFKTGAAPSPKMVKAGYNSQLPLTAAMIARGGLEGRGAPAPGDLLYVRVTGRNPPGREELRGAAGSESAERAEKALAGLAGLVARFADSDTGYLARTAPASVRYVGDYDHLARTLEWRQAEDDEEVFG